MRVVSVFLELQGDKFYCPCCGGEWPYENFEYDIYDDFEHPACPNGCSVVEEPKRRIKNETFRTSQIQRIGYFG
jgi:hypothetical protein